ncbi:hypothetical protein ACWFRM_28325 [Streptomyces sp. NPDC055144]
MRHHRGSLLRRTAVGVFSLAAHSATCGAAAAAPAREAESIDSTQRYRALQHGGVVRAANAAISCRPAAAAAKVSCPVARSGGANGRVGMVAYNGVRGVKGDAPSVSPGRRARLVTLGNAADPADDVLNSNISEPGRAQPRRVPAYANTLGYDSDVFALGRNIRKRGSGLDLRMTSRRDTAWIGVLFAAVDARP